jgi:hypothetical protein|tara:strand:+ start:392 stop:691 length:300 start_codon:yes stop_codon:yes gene_type:complete
MASNYLSSSANWIEEIEMSGVSQYMLVSTGSFGGGTLKAEQEIYPGEWVTVQGALHTSANQTIFTSPFKVRVSATGFNSSSTVYAALEPIKNLPYSKRL